MSVLKVTRFGVTPSARIWLYTSSASSSSPDLMHTACARSQMWLEVCTWIRGAGLKCGLACKIDAKHHA